MILSRAWMIVVTTSAFLSVPFLTRALGTPVADAEPHGVDLRAHSLVVCGVIEDECLGGGEEHHNFVEDFPLWNQESKGKDTMASAKSACRGGRPSIPTSVTRPAVVQRRTRMHKSRTAR